MLKGVFENLDAWAVERNLNAIDACERFLPVTDILIIGQTALLEAKFDFPVVATMDVDAYKEITYRIKVKFEELLAIKGKHLDPVGHEAWMPDETEFKTIHDGKIIIGKIAEPVFVIISKAKKSPEKNKFLIADYLASQCRDDRIFDLADKYQIDLEKLI